MIEEWRKIEGYEGLYEVSNLGNVRSIDKWVNRNGDKYFKKGRVLKPMNDKKGYVMVNLSKEGKTKVCYIHRLVAKAFIPNPENLPEVNHINEVKTNNCVENLEWCTHEYNNNYGTRTERIVEKLVNGKTSKKVQAFNKDGELVFEFPSVMEAGRNGFNYGHISSCCNGKKKTHKGLIWKYA